MLKCVVSRHWHAVADVQITAPTVSRTVEGGVMPRVTGRMGMGFLIVAAIGCSEQTDGESTDNATIDTAVTVAEFSISQECDEAFAKAAAVSPQRDTHGDLFSAYSACESIEEWKAASAKHPDAIDGVDPVRYAMTVCAGNQERLGETVICRALNEPALPVAGGLEASGDRGLMGVSLPEGAELIQATPGDASLGRDPSERYSISASASEIAGYFNRELVQAGWQKDGTSTATALFFEKGPQMVGVLINSNGGTFTLMGS